MVNPSSPPSQVADSPLTEHEEPAESSMHPADVHEPNGHARHVEVTAMSILSGLLWTARPHQWVKNLVVLAPIVFAKEIFVPWLMIRAVGCFAVFCVLAAAVYTMNDLADVEADRLHPRKRHRPIAAGLVPEKAAKIFAVCLVAVGLFGAALFSIPFLVTVASYFAMNVAYSLKLKHWPYLDVGIISAGFVLRVLAGGFGTNIAVSTYLFVCTAFGALFLGFGKRRHELSGLLSGKKSGKQRKVLQAYSVRGLDFTLWITGLAAVGVYLAYTLDAHTRELFGSDRLWWSVAPVVFGVLRFVHLVRSRPHAESPTQEMLKDGPFVAFVLMWGAMVMWVVYKLQPGA
jgi:decaprenyl-phosphate phosphoribosyltransferase